MAEIFASADLAANVKQFPLFIVSYRMCTFFVRVYLVVYLIVYLYVLAMG